MNFSDFRGISEVQEKFDITYAEEDFVKVHDAEPSEQFLQEFEWTQQNLNIFASEAARRETIVFPILRENYKAYADNCELWIETSIAYNQTLSGTPDYLVGARSQTQGIEEKPFRILVEVKTNKYELGIDLRLPRLAASQRKINFKRGWGQCLAALVAAQKINNDANLANLPVYGIVTDGVVWQFGRLVGDTFTQNRTDFEWTNLPMLFGAVSAVFKAATESASTRT